MKDAVIVSAVRTPVGKAKRGGLATVRPDEMAATAIREFQTMTPEQLSEFSLPGLFVGTILHLTISVAIGLLFAVLLPMLPGHPLLWSLIAGGVLWVFADVVLLLPLNPIMSSLVNVPSFIVAHLVYTIILGLWVSRYEKVPIR